MEKSLFYWCFGSTVYYEGKLRQYCIFQSETYETLDCLFYDDGINVNPKWVGGTPVSDGVGATISSSSNRMYVRVEKDTTIDNYDWITPCVVEFEILAISGSIGLQAVGNHNNIANNGNYNQWLQGKGAGFWKIEVYEDKLVSYYKKTIDSEYTKQVEPLKDMGDKTDIRWLLESNSSVKFRDFKMYPI